jgi:hypothetical protein
LSSDPAYLATHCQLVDLALFNDIKEIVKKIEKLENNFPHSLKLVYLLCFRQHIKPLTFETFQNEIGD